MIKFSELYSNLDELKKVNLAQRRKQAIRMQRLTKSSAFKKKVEKSKLKVLPPEKLKIKAQKKAKETIINKYFPKYKDMDMMGRYRIDQIVATKYGAAITKIALKIMPKMKAMEVQKVKDARQAKQDA
jgi:hypothetical protein